ncbi:30S ribosomal protein S8, partial [Mycoplasmopsis bovis]
EVSLKYKGNQSAIIDFKRISKPGLRVYASANNLPSVLSGYGTAIISTSKGVMTEKQARKENVGGEVLAYIW